jgi:heme/copper-type cytochrome/quinol oxidase subunit 3
MSTQPASRRARVGPGTLTETPEELAYELRAAEASFWTGTRLLLGIAIFVLSSLAFAYFYLRSTNSASLFRPGGLTAPTDTGAAIMAFTVATAAGVLVAVRLLRRAATLDWQVAGWMSVLGGLIAVGLQAYQLTQLPFFPGASGYSSCFVGWAVLNIIMILAGVYWCETLLARFLRLRRAFADEGGTPGTPLPSARLFRANADGCAYYWGFVAAVAVLFWLLFYVI